MNKRRYIITKTILYRVLYTIKNPQVRHSFTKYFPEDAILRRKARWSWLLYGMPAYEFVRLSCENLSLNDIKNFVSFYEFKHLYSVINSIAVKKVFNDKFQCYQRFSRYFKREVVFISNDEIFSGEAMNIITELFYRGHNRVVVKPLRSCCGRGIGVYDNPEDVLKALVSYGEGGGILEGFISQSKELSDFNNSSVNTLRIQTVNYGGGEVEVLWPCLRMGRSGSFVDNAGAGGVFGAIDVNTGAIIGVSDEKRHFYTEHPDSHKQLIGFVIPLFKEACELAREMAHMIPQATIVGWDLALTDNGWVLVEGNSSPLIIWQIASRQGIREKFKEIENRTIFNKHCSK